MLEPRVSDLPAVFMVLIVLPMVTYFLLGKWHEFSQKRNRISVLAQLAFEEVIRAEAIPPFDVIPTVSSPTSSIYECARCSAPATTRCSRCKSIRYCSGHCQIAHWRQVHKDECQLCPENSKSRSYISTGSSTGRGSSPPDSSVKKHPKSLIIPSENSSELCFNIDSTCPTNETSQITEFGSAFPSEVSFMQTAPVCKVFEGNYSTMDDPSGNSESNSSTFSCEGDYSQNLVHQYHKSTSETMVNTRQPRNSRPVSTTCMKVENANNEAKTVEGSSQKFDPHNESLKRNVSSSRRSVSRETLNYERPPYTLGIADPTTSQKSVKKMQKEHMREILKNACVRNETILGSGRKASIQGESIHGDARNASTVIESKASGGFSAMQVSHTETQQSSKDPKRSLLGLLNLYKRKKAIFPYEDLVRLFQCESCYISPRGLLNCGNSCYANAVLQCLMCTKPLMAYLLQRMHSKSCSVRDWCLMCELEQHVSMLQEGGGPLSPIRMLSNMRNGGWRMCGGNQEDAHEFLRVLVMSLQSICLEGLGGEKNVDLRMQETTLIYQIFGGRLRSKVKCTRCHHESEIYENIMDLTLEIHGSVESLEDALRLFTSIEELNGENMYKCGRCCRYVNAVKQLSVHEVPNILTVVLKRFQKGQHGKLNKYVTFPEMLDMTPFVTGTADVPPLYSLYAVVVHLDSQNVSQSGGHYVSYIKDLHGMWFRINDAELQAVPMSQVMSEGAYMLFYTRPFPRPPEVYLGKANVQAAPSPSRNDRGCGTQRSSRNGEPMQHGMFRLASIGESTSVSRDTVGDGEAYHGTASFPRSFSTEFSDATSSDWSLFTSSDDSSIATESTRDSFSTADHSDTPGNNPISSFFGHYYCPDFPYNTGSGGVSCSKTAASRSETGFFSEKKGFVVELPGKRHLPLPSSKHGMRR